MSKSGSLDVTVKNFEKLSFMILRCQNLFSDFYLFCIRVDIPALYNNLDASQDTSVFSQYTQSQEESMYVLKLWICSYSNFFTHCITTNCFFLGTN